MRQLARREQLERAREPVGVVDERAGDHELVEQDAVVVELRARGCPRRRARACPARFSCASAASIARLLPEHSSATSNGSSTRSCGIAGDLELLGLRPCARRAARTARGACPCGSLTTMSSTPSALQRGDREEPDRPAAGDEPARARAGAAAAGDAVQRDRERLGQRGVLRATVRRGRAAAARRRWSCSGRTRPASRRRRRRPGPARAQRRPAREAVLALAALGRRPADHPVADVPAGDAVAHGDDRAASTRGPRSRPRAHPTRARKCRSEPQTPQWLTSSEHLARARIAGRGRSSTATSRRPMNTAAGIVVGKWFGHGRALGHAEGSPEPDTGVKVGGGACETALAFGPPLEVP